MAGTCGMMGGRRRRTSRRGGQPPTPTAPPKEIVPLRLKDPVLFNAIHASRERKASEDKNAMGRGRRKTRKLRGGNGYGFTAAPSDVINAGNIAWTANMTSVPSGQPVVGSVTGGRRRSRKNQKAEKARRSRGRSARLIKELASYKMKGGGSVANVGYGFAGTGARGISDPIPYAANTPPGGAFAIPTGTR